jgi:hypothetical protein
MAPRGERHSLTLAVGIAQHFGLGEGHHSGQRQTANPGSIPPLGTILDAHFISKEVN